MLKKSLIAKTYPKANNSQIFISGCIRVTVITSRLIRVEKSKNGFVDDASTAIWFRKFEPPTFHIEDLPNKINIITDDIILHISKSTGIAEKVTFKSSGKTFDCRNFANLRGTKRTLDFTSGKVALNNGLLSTDGVAELDDSNSFLINDNGMFAPRKNNGSDIYVFAYESNYRQAICDYYKISSPPPIVPRYALGVWWSRYRHYTQDEYQNLMLKFKSEDIPLSVATVDMDWHWTDVNKEFGTNYKSRFGTDNPVTGGWTGYSWDTDLFPDYKGFLKFLKNENLHITLNLHPADGIRHFETMYDDMAKAMEIDPKTKEPVKFRCGSDTFWNSYFDIVHKPYEKDGVDFWWIDWQQGKKCDVKGLDPLIPLNHYHYLDNAEDGRIPLILSRYSGFGAHRYPLGFSGDTMMNWAVLDFQPYFTITAANAGYTWWSHDIGGHHHGISDNALYLRWIQFGVFSPIMRLHSTSDDLLGKEPWKHSAEVCRLAKEWLRLRHKLIPYIYTMDERTHNDGIALCEPMYYSYPDISEAYDVKNQYMFGSELMVCPITTKQHVKTDYGSVRVWVPKGRWTDVFTGQRYIGPMSLDMHRELDSIPVLAKEGAIIPMSNDTGNKTDNPKSLLVNIFAGNNSFTLYEDNGKTDCDCHNVKTKFDVEYDEKCKVLRLNITAPAGDKDLIPSDREYLLKFADISQKSSITVNGKSAEWDSSKKYAFVKLSDFTMSEDINIEITDAALTESEPKKEQLIHIMSRWQASNDKKKFAYARFKKANTKEELMEELEKAILPVSVASAILERLLAE